MGKNVDFVDVGASDSSVENWALGHGVQFEDYEVIRRIRNGRNWTALLAENKSGDRKTLTYLENDKIIERYKMWAYQNGVSQNSLDRDASRYLSDYHDKIKATVDRVKGIECLHVATVNGYSYDREKEELVLISDYTPGVDIFDACRMLNWKQILFLFSQVLKGLVEIHSFGILHMNIKPSRIYVDFGPKIPDVKFTDFGFAIPASGYDGKYNGTLFYMAPEVVLEEHDKVGFKSDLFSLGVTMYYCLTGHQPYGERFIVQSDKHRLISQIKNEVDLKIKPSHYRSEISDDLDEMILDLLRRSVDDRPYRRAREVLNHIEELWPDECQSMIREGSTTLVSYEGDDFDY